MSMSCSHSENGAPAYCCLRIHRQPSEMLWATVLLWVHVQGWTPLHCAAQFNRADIAHRLILAGSDVCATDKQVSAQPTCMP